MWSGGGLMLAMLNHRVLLSNWQRRRVICRGWTVPHAYLTSVIRRFLPINVMIPFWHSGLKSATSDCLHMFPSFVLPLFSSLSHFFSFGSGLFLFSNTRSSVSVFCFLELNKVNEIFFLSLFFFYHSNFYPFIIYCFSSLTAIWFCFVLCLSSYMWPVLEYIVELWNLLSSLWNIVILDCWRRKFFQYILFCPLLRHIHTQQLRHASQRYLLQALSCTSKNPECFALSCRKWIKLDYRK